MGGGALRVHVSHFPSRSNTFKFQKQTHGTTHVIRKNQPPFPHKLTRLRLIACQLGGLLIVI